MLRGRMGSCTLSIPLTPKNVPKKYAENRGVNLRIMSAVPQIACAQIRPNTLPLASTVLPTGKKAPQPRLRAACNTLIFLDKFGSSGGIWLMENRSARTIYDFTLIAKSTE